jgi:hypothetical protein
MTPAMCLDPAKAQKNLIRTPNSLQNHEQRRASAGKLCLSRYPASHAGFVQRIPKDGGLDRQASETNITLRMPQDRANSMLKV